MKMKGSTVKYFSIALILIMAIAAAMSTAACRRSSGDGGGTTATGTGGGGSGDGGGGGLPPQPPVVFTTPKQAAASNTSAQSIRALSDAQFGAAIDMGLSSQPAGFAPRLNGDRTGIDPAISAAIDQMGKMASSSPVKKAVQKAGAMRVKRANSFTNLAVPDSCFAGGTATLSGTNNYDDVNSTIVNSEYVITFVNCRDNIMLTELNGTISIEVNESIDTNAIRSNLTAILTEKKYSDETFATVISQSHMDGAFDDNDQLTTGSRSANGLFIVTIPAQGATPEHVTTYEYTGLTELRTTTPNADLSDTLLIDLTGTFKVTRASGGVTASVVSMKVDLEDKTQHMNDAAGTRRNWIDGSVEITRSPAVDGCLTGSMTIATAANAPRTFTIATGFTCPASGSVKINNSTITYSRPIQVSIDGGSTESYADCAAMEAVGGICTQ